MLISVFAFCKDRSSLAYYDKIVYTQLGKAGKFRFPTGINNVWGMGTLIQILVQSSAVRIFISQSLSPQWVFLLRFDLSFRQKVLAFYLTAFGNLNARRSLLLFSAQNIS